MNYQKYLSFWTKAIPQKKRIITDYKNDVFSTDYNEYRDKVDLIVFDVDDTIVDFKGKFTEKTYHFISDIKTIGFKLAVFSNCSQKRMDEMTHKLKKYDIYIVNRTDKPAPDGFLEAMNHYNVKPERTLVIGDKLGTEMYGAYLAHIKYRILVKPYSEIFGGKRANPFHRLIRKIEKQRYFKATK